MIEEMNKEMIEREQHNQKRIMELNKEIERLKEEYVMLQNASDEVEEELQQRIDKAIEYIENMPYLQEVDEEFENVDGEVYFTYKEWDDTELLDILKGVDKE